MRNCSYNPGNAGLASKILRTKDLSSAGVVRAFWCRFFVERAVMFQFGFFWGRSKGWLSHGVMGGCGKGRMRRYLGKKESQNPHVSQRTRDVGHPVPSTLARGARTEHPPIAAPEGGIS